MSQPKVSTRKIPGFLKPTDLPDPDLKNDVDPIFATLAKCIGDESHPAYPALRLATLLLTILLPVFHAILSQDSAAGIRGSERNLPEPKARLTETEQQETRKWLAAISDASKFEVRRMCRTSNDAVTKARFKHLVALKPLPIPDFPGFGSKIIIKKEIIKKITRAHAHGEKVLYFAALLNLASTIVHELAHAACNATYNTKAWPDACKAPFLGDALTDEVGFEVEKRLFGGILHTSHTSSECHFMLNGESQKPGEFLKGKIVIIDWPNPSVVKIYDESSSGIRLKTGLTLQPAFVAWDVSVEKVAEMFSEKFWSKDKLDTCLSQRLLHSTRETGIVHLVDQPKSHDLRLQALAELSTADIIPAGYEMDRQGFVRPITEHLNHPFKSCASEMLESTEMLESILEQLSHIM